MLHSLVGRSNVEVPRHQPFAASTFCGRIIRKGYHRAYWRPWLLEPARVEVRRKFFPLQRIDRAEIPIRLVHSCIEFDEYVHQSELNYGERLHMVRICNLSPPLTANANTDLTSSWLAYNLLAACADCQGFMQAVPKYVCDSSDSSIRLTSFIASLHISNPAKFLKRRRTGNTSSTLISLRC